MLVEIILSLIATVMGFAVWLFNLFSDARVAIGLVLLMVTIAILVLSYLFFFKITPVSNDIRWISNQIEQLHSHKDFVDVFTKVDTSILKIRYIAHGWSEFKKTLIFPEKGTDNPIRNTYPAEDFINLHTASRSGYSFNFFHAMTDYFVGMGLVFTFLGLVSALNFASAGLAADNPNETKRQFGFLLSAATFKFLTSITGVALSIIYSLIKDRWLVSLEMRFTRLCEALESRMMVVTPESIAFMQLRELRKQNELLQQIKER